LKTCGQSFFFLKLAKELQTTESCIWQPRTSDKHKSKQGKCLMFRHVFGYLQKFK